MSKLERVNVKRIHTKAVRFLNKQTYRISRHWDFNFSPIFICGIAGSGTTLLTAMLNQNYNTAAYLPESALAAPKSSSLHLMPVKEYPDLSSFTQALFFPPNSQTNEIREDCLNLYRAHVSLPKLSNVVLDKAPNAHLVRSARLAEAFPNAYFVLIVRNPLSSIEGLRRKWPLFGNASIIKNCEYWDLLHESFMAQTSQFEGRWIGITYEDFIQDSAGWLETIAQKNSLVVRDEPIPYADEPNEPGKGLRNVKRGVIEIDKESENLALNRITEDAEIIRAKLEGKYLRLKDYFSGKESTSKVDIE